MTNASSANPEMMLLLQVAEITGCSENALREYIKKGDLIKQKHWFKKNGRIWFDMQEFYNWVREKDE